jgi:alpha-ketoglutarate-dependent taurine dioxygenase
MLRAVSVPTCGGCTLFGDLRAAFEDLPQKVRATYRTFRAVYSLRHLMAPLMELRQGRGTSAALAEQYPDVVHSLVWHHSYTCRESVFLSELCLTKIVELSVHESAPALTDLYAHCLVYLPA